MSSSTFGGLDNYDSPSGSGSSGATDVARQHAQEVAATVQDRAGEVTAHAQDVAHQVAGTAAAQAQNVKQETVRQARNLAGEATSQLHDQAGQQTQRLAGTLRELAEELTGMAQGGQQGGTATELVHQAAERTHSLAGYLEGKEPRELLEDLRTYARRRPGAFLAGAAVAGLLAGRVGRGVKDANSSSSSSTGSGPAVTRADVATPTSVGVIPPVGPGIAPAQVDPGVVDLAVPVAGLPQEPTIYTGTPAELDENGVRL